MARVCTMGDRREGQVGGHLPPLEFEKMTSYAAVLQNTLAYQSKRPKNAKNFVCAFGSPQNGQFFVRRAKNFLSVGGFVPPPS